MIYRLYYIYLMLSRSFNSIRQKKKKLLKANTIRIEATWPGKCLLPSAICSAWPAKPPFTLLSNTPTWKDKAFSWPDKHLEGLEQPRGTQCSTNTDPRSLPTQPGIHLGNHHHPQGGTGQPRQTIPCTTLSHGKRGLKLPEALTTQPLPDTRSDLAQ